MAENKEIIDRLETRLNDLVRTQIDFQKEILQIRAELAALRGSGPPTPASPPPSDRSRLTFTGSERPPQQPSPPTKTYAELPPQWSAASPEESKPSQHAEEPKPSQQIPPRPRQQVPTTGTPTAGAPSYRPPINPQEGAAPNFGYAPDTPPVGPAKPKERSDLEKFIGENLLSKLAIVLMIIGVGIGAKYAIDRGWITPVMRIVFGYLIGAVLLGLSFKLKKKYLSFSAVLLGGGMAIMYFITYFAYGLYELIPQSVAFGLMMMFTVFTVAMALVYNRQAIAHFGLVGAYAVPFLLSNNSGNYAFLFTYISIINVGILSVSIRKYWKPLVYTSFLFTWATFFGWYITKYDPEAHFHLGLIFLGIFFAIFYLTTIIQHRLFAERTAFDDLVITILNAIVFYGFSISMTELREDSFATMFTFVAAFTVGILILSISDYRKPLLFASFAGSWILYLAWFATKYTPDEHLYFGLIFLGVFFSIFYLATIIEHRFLSGKTGPGELFLSILNAAAFYGLCLAMFDARHDSFPLLFGYVAAFTIGILVISIRDYRRPLLYASFIGSWLIYAVWFLEKYDPSRDFGLAVTFLCVFFAVFYIAGLVHSNMFKEKAVVENTAPILTNSFVFFGLGYSLIHHRPGFENYLGLYTVAHAAFHFIVSSVTSRVKSFPVEITYLLTALVITFITIAIPIQFDGHVITLVWSVEAAILFWSGRAKMVRIFEYFSYPLMLLATGSLLNDWINAAQLRTIDSVAWFERPFTNGNFITALVYVGSLAVIYYINRDEDHEAAIDPENKRSFGILIAAVGAVALYNTFRIEIDNYFHYLSVKTLVSRDGLIRTDDDLDSVNWISQINYTMLFASLLSLVNFRKVRSIWLAHINLVLNVGSIVVFISVGLFLLGLLRDSYIKGWDVELFARTPFHIYIRYICYVFAAGLFFATYRYTKQAFVRQNVPIVTLERGFDFVFYLPLLVIVSSELINLMDMFGYNESYKLGLSILWGVYALFLVIIGIRFAKKHLRVGAIVLFAVTLVKVVVFDISHLSTIAKTAVFISLAITMLIVSFLYNKYKVLIFGDDNSNTDDEKLS